MQLAKGKYSHIDAMSSAQLDTFIEGAEIAPVEHAYAVKLAKKRAEA
jgi:hypothetical protein